jgi:hypothetical protein
MELTGLFFLLVIGSSIWLYFDAKAIGADRPFLYFVGSLLFWIVVFPMYVASRRTIINRNAK